MIDCQEDLLKNVCKRLLLVFIHKYLQKSIMKKKIHILFYFSLFFHTSMSFSKEKVVIFPIFSIQQNICNLLSKDFDTNATISKIGEGFDNDNIEIIQPKKYLNNVILDIHNCHQTILIDKILEISNARFLLMYEYEFIETSNGNYVKLQMILKNSEEEHINSYYAKSNKMYTDDKAGLVKLAFKKIRNSVIQDIENYSFETKEDIEIITKNNQKIDENFVSELEINIPKTSIINENAVAVVIGNSIYNSQDIPKVDFAIQDAKVMKKYLRESFGFKEENIIYIENASFSDLNNVFGNEKNEKGKLFNYVKPKISDVFVFYSGHGAPYIENKEAYIVPIDANPSMIQMSGYSLKTLYTNLGKTPYKTLTLVIDACFSGNSAGGTLLKNISPIRIKTEEKIFKDNNALIITSCSSEQVSSWYSEKKHSLLTYFFLKSLRGEADIDKNQQVTVVEMRNYLNENITYWARRLNNREQTPKVWGKDEKILIQYK
jgi:hypothetical protein